MKLPNGYGSAVKLSGKRRKPYQVRKTVGWHYDEEKDTQVQDMITVGYTATRAEGLQIIPALFCYSGILSEFRIGTVHFFTISNVAKYTMSLT